MGGNNRGKHDNHRTGGTRDLHIRTTKDGSNKASHHCRDESSFSTDSRAHTKGKSQRQSHYADGETSEKI